MEKSAYSAGPVDANVRQGFEDLEQAEFEKWLRDKCPSGDVDSVQWQWLHSYEYAELLDYQEPLRVVYAAANKTSLVLFANKQEAVNYASAAGATAGVTVSEIAVIGSAAPQPSRDDVIEECAKVMQDSGIGGEHLADTLRAMKGKS